MSPIGSDASVWVVDPSAKPGGAEQVRENTVRRSKVLIGAAERMIFQKKHMGPLFPLCRDPCSRSTVAVYISP